jgi:hypothetical protein
MAEINGMSVHTHVVNPAKQQISTEKWTNTLDK